jgi:DNA-binding response OmpR family regulator
MNKSSELLLLIEDDPNDILLFEKAISRNPFGVELVVIRDGEKAISYLSGNGDTSGQPAPDLVLLDLKLPRKSGFEVLEWIKKHPVLHTVPVIILSSSKQTQDLKTAYSLGANSYLVKPTGFSELNKLIEDLGSYWFKHNQTLKTN